MDQNELLELKEKVEVAKTKVTEIKAKQEYLLKELKDNHNCKSISEAEEENEKMDAEIEKIDTDINVAVKELEEKYNL